MSIITYIHDPRFTKQQFRTFPWTNGEYARVFSSFKSGYTEKNILRSSYTQYNCVYPRLHPWVLLLNETMQRPSDSFTIEIVQLSRRRRHGRRGVMARQRWRHGGGVMARRLRRHRETSRLLESPLLYVYKSSYFITIFSLNRVSWSQVILPLPLTISQSS